VRFDDSLQTVLAADASTAFGAQAMFRQLADLVARGRVPAEEQTLQRLRTLREQVPTSVRGAVARGMALASPPGALVAVFAEDEPEIASAALRGARLSPDDWITLLPTLGPTGRASLRLREDLDPVVQRALESFGSTDFTIGYVPPPPVDQPAPPPFGASPFTAVGAITGALPIVEAARRSGEAPQPREDGGFEIAELVDRIATFQHVRGSGTVATPPPIERFRFETDAAGTITWTDAAPRGALVGVSLMAAGTTIGSRAAEALRRRVAFMADWTLDGTTTLAGCWSLSGTPMFDPATSAFIGYRGGARRVVGSHEGAGTGGSGAGAEGLRRLVHELRTPTNAIAGFSELIEAQLLGPVAPPYRERASAIRDLAAGLVAAIEDLDLAARVEGDALDLRSGSILLAPLLGKLVAEVQPLAVQRGGSIALAPMDASLAITGDDRATERLIHRLLATLASMLGTAEAIVVSASGGGDGRVTVGIGRPRLLVGMSGDHLLSLDAAGAAGQAGASLLGTGFALRLVRNLSAKLGSELVIGPDRFTITLPAAAAATGQVATH
jgi:hypothetical protein